MDHINKVEALADQFFCLEVSVKSEDVVIPLLKRLPPSYEYLITVLETMPMMELIMKYVTTHLIHKMSKRKKKDPKDDTATVVHQGKAGNPS